MDQAEGNSSVELRDAAEQLGSQSEIDVCGIDSEPMDSLLQGDVLPDMSPDLLSCLVESLSREGQSEELEGEKGEGGGERDSDVETPVPTGHSETGEVVLQSEEGEKMGEEVVTNEPMEVTETDRDENGNDNKTDSDDAVGGVLGGQDDGEGMMPTVDRAGKLCVVDPSSAGRAGSSGELQSPWIPSQISAEKEVESSDDDFLYGGESQEEQPPLLKILRLESPSPTPSSQQSSQLQSKQPVVQEEEESEGDIEREDSSADDKADHTVLEVRDQRMEHAPGENNMPEQKSLESRENVKATPTYNFGLFTNSSAFKLVLENTNFWKTETDKGQSSQKDGGDKKKLPDQGLEQSGRGGEESALPVAIAAGQVREESGRGRTNTEPEQQREPATIGSGRGGAESGPEIPDVPPVPTDHGKESGRGGAESEKADVDNSAGADDVNTLEVDVVGTCSEVDGGFSTLEIDADNVPSADEVEITGLSPSEPVESQCQLHPSEHVDGPPPSEATPPSEAAQKVTHQPSVEAGQREEGGVSVHSSAKAESRPPQKRRRESPKADDQSDSSRDGNEIVEKDASHKPGRPKKAKKDNLLLQKTKKIKLTIDRMNKHANKKDVTGNITMETPRHSQPPFQPPKESPEKYSQEYLRPSSHAGPSTSVPSSHDPSNSGLSAVASSFKAPSLHGPLTSGTRSARAPSTASFSTSSSGSRRSSISSSTSERPGHPKSRGGTLTGHFQRDQRVIDPVYHDDPDLERWRRLLEGHWFEVMLQKSQRPMTVAEKRSTKLLGLFLD